jgi:hypothetical protein
MKVTRTFTQTQNAYLEGYKHIINKGGTRSSKSFSTLQLLYIIANKSKRKRVIHCVSHSTPHLREGIIADFERILTEEGENIEKIRTQNPNTYRINKSVIKFLGFDKLGKSLGAARDILFVNEANKMPFEIVHQLIVRTTECVFYDYNPSEPFWITEEGISERENAITLHSTFHLNVENLSDSQIDELLEAKKKHDKEVQMGIAGYWYNYWRVYGLGLDGAVDMTNKFMFAFIEGKHVRSDIQHNPKLPVRLSFDFNIEPFVCTLYQMPDSDTVNVFDQIILNDSDIYQVTDMVKARYPNSFLQVTGDVSGGNRTGAVRGKASYWMAIKSELHLTSAQIRLRGQNLGLIESRVLCNSALIHKNIYLSSKLTNLINDCKYAKVDDTGMLVKDRNKNKNDSLDTFRYILDAEFPNIIKHHKK